MSETKGAAMSETAVERRLRDEREDGCECHRCESLDLGADAIALLRRYRDGDDDGRLVKHVAALLARCEGEK